MRILKKEDLMLIDQFHFMQLMQLCTLKQDEQEMQMYSKYKMAQRQWKHRADLGWETKRASVKIMEVVEIHKGGQGELFLSIL